MKLDDMLTVTHKLTYLILTPILWLAAYYAGVWRLSHSTTAIVLGACSSFGIGLLAGMVVGLEERIELYKDVIARLRAYHEED